MKSTIRAFTLLESLLVLAISSFLLLLFAGGGMTVVHTVRSILFLAQFENDYKSAQIQAESTHQMKAFTLPKETDEVRFSGTTITFDAQGNNSSLKKLVFTLPYVHQTVSYQLEMGSGKYRKTVLHE
ncbi:MAG: type II secretion system GspH family protein [Streptococcaceae bacterium]|nr:type II secretion system GspH family protein [Streptococcaceae bacterium]